MVRSSNACRRFPDRPSGLGRTPTILIPISPPTSRFIWT